MDNIIVIDGVEVIPEVDSRVSLFGLALSMTPVSYSNEKKICKLLS